MSFQRLFDNCLSNPEQMLIGVAVVAVLYLIGLQPGRKVDR